MSALDSEYCSMYMPPLATNYGGTLIFNIISASSTSVDLNESSKDKSKTPKSKDMHLPISRVRTIMKSTPDIENIGLPSLHVVTKATVSYSSTH